MINWRPISIIPYAPKVKIDSTLIHKNTSPVIDFGMKAFFL